MLKFFNHQIKVLNETKIFNKVAYYLDMGLGKTFIGAEKLMQMRTTFNLIVCQKSKVADWVEHFKKYYNEHPYMIEVFNLTAKGQLGKFIDKTNEKIDDSVDPRQIIGVINYDLAWRRKSLLQIENFSMLLDESSLIQNSKAERTKFVLRTKQDNVILLSGTPSSGKYENLWSQIHLLGWNISEELFHKQYVNYKKVNIGGFIHKVIDQENPYKNVDRLKDKLHEHGAVFMKTEECFELPKQNFIKTMIPSNMVYKKFAERSVITLDTKNLVEFIDDSDFYGQDVTPRIELIGDTTLTKRLYERQLCGQYSSEKLNAFKDLLNSTNERIVVFYNFNEELNKLKKIAEDLEKPISEVNGRIKNLRTYEIEDNSVTFVQYQAGAMGLNLQKANRIIYFTLPDKSELFEQSKKRIHRIGQDKSCFYYLMICNNTIEEAILDTLEKRKDFDDELFREYESLWQKNC